MGAGVEIIGDASHTIELAISSQSMRRDAMSRLMSAIVEIRTGDRPTLLDGSAAGVAEFLKVQAAFGFVSDSAAASIAAEAEEAERMLVDSVKTPDGRLPEWWGSTGPEHEDRHTAALVALSGMTRHKE